MAPQKPAAQHPPGRVCATWARAASFTLGWDMQGMLPGEHREARRACLAHVRASQAQGRWSAQGMLAGEQCSMHTVGREGTAVLAQGWGQGIHCLWGRGWDTQRQDSDRMGQSLGLCLLRLILVLRPPHRGLLAAACPSQALHWLGCGARQGTHTPWGSSHYSAVLHMW